MTVYTYSAVYIPYELSVCVHTEIFSLPFPLFTLTSALYLLFFTESSRFLFSLVLCCYVLTAYCNIGHVCLCKCGTDINASSGATVRLFHALHIPSSNMLVVTASWLHWCQTFIHNLPFTALQPINHSHHGHQECKFLRSL
jgi:hypothetical protein